MKLFLTIILLSLFTFANSQTVNSPFKRQNKPISVIHHKFDKTKSKVHKDVTTPEHRTCATYENYIKLQSKYDLPSKEEYEKYFENIRLKKFSKSGTVITIPVIVHVVHNGEAVGTGANISSAQVSSQIEVLNNDFRKKVGTSGYNTHSDGADIEIEFALALRDEYGNILSEPGIHRVNGNYSFWERADIENTLKPQTIWEPEKYMNIWTITFGGDDKNLLGYAQFPSLSGLEGASTNGGLATTDGVVVKYSSFGTVGEVSFPYDGGRTATHEVGHWLGLRHIWGDGNCLEDDYCDDTPRAGHPNESCETINSCWLYSGDDMIENYMDYTPDACMNIFTLDQKSRMITVMQTSPRRKELSASNVHLSSSDSPIAYFSSDIKEICTNENITFTDKSINTPTSWKWTFYDTSNTDEWTFTDQNPVLTFPDIGVYSLQLIVSNSLGSDTIFEPNYISVLSSDKLAFPFSESFEYLDALDK